MAAAAGAGAERRVGFPPSPILTRVNEIAFWKPAKFSSLIADYAGGYLAYFPQMGRVYTFYILEHHVFKVITQEQLDKFQVSLQNSFGKAVNRQFLPAFHAFCSAMIKVEMSCRAPQAQAVAGEKKAALKKQIGDLNARIAVFKGQGNGKDKGASKEVINLEAQVAELKGQLDPLTTGCNAVGKLTTLQIPRFVQNARDALVPLFSARAIDFSQPTLPFCFKDITPYVAYCLNFGTQQMNQAVAEVFKEKVLWGQNGVGTISIGDLVQAISQAYGLTISEMIDLVAREIEVFFPLLNRPSEAFQEAKKSIIKVFFNVVGRKDRSPETMHLMQAVSALENKLMGPLFDLAKVVEAPKNDLVPVLFLLPKGFQPPKLILTREEYEAHLTQLFPLGKRIQGAIAQDVPEKWSVFFEKQGQKIHVVETPHEKRFALALPSSFAFPVVYKDQMEGAFDAAIKSSEALIHGILHSSIEQTLELANTYLEIFFTELLKGRSPQEIVETIEPVIKMLRLLRDAVLPTLLAGLKEFNTQSTFRKPFNEIVLKGIVGAVAQMSKEVFANMRALDVNSLFDRTVHLTLETLTTMTQSFNQMLPPAAAVKK